MKDESEASARVLWDTTARQKVIRWHAKAIAINATIMVVILVASHVDVMIAEEQIALSQFIGIPLSMVNMAAIGYSVAQIRRMGQIMGRDKEK